MGMYRGERPRTMRIGYLTNWMKSGMIDFYCYEISLLETWLGVGPGGLRIYTNGLEFTQDYVLINHVIDSIYVRKQFHSTFCSYSFYHPICTLVSRIFHSSENTISAI